MQRCFGGVARLSQVTSSSAASVNLPGLLRPVFVVSSCLEGCFGVYVASYCSVDYCYPVCVVASVGFGEDGSPGGGGLLVSVGFGFDV